MTPTKPSKLQTQLDQLKACIHCGFCLPVCPTYKATGSEAESPRGRLYLLKKMLDESLPEGEQLTHQQVQPHLSQCLGCLACETACPSGVEYGSLLNASKKLDLNHQPLWLRHLRRFAFKNILPNSALLRLGLFPLQLYQRSGLQALLRALNVFKMIPLLHHYESLIPTMSNHKPFNAGLSFGNPEHERVALFTGCVMDALYNPVHWATIKALVNNDYYVTLPEQTCCGALAHHGGEEDIAQDLARQNILSILKSSPDWVVINSAGCGSSMQEYTGILANDNVYAEKARIFSSITIDIMALLAKRPLKPGQTKKPIRHQTVAYHAACHLHHAQGVIHEPEAVLSQVEGITLIPLKDASFCCGSAGIYNLEHPHLSNTILAEKMRHVEATQAQTLVSGNPGCLLQLAKGLYEKGSSIRLAHPIELVAESYL